MFPPRVVSVYVFSNQCILCSLHFVLLCLLYTADPHLYEHEDSPHSESRINNDAQKIWRRARQKSDTSKAMALSAYSSPIPIVHIETLLRITARTNEFVATNALSPGSWPVVFTQLANPSGRHDSLFHALRPKASCEPQ